MKPSKNAQAQKPFNPLPKVPSAIPWDPATQWDLRKFAVPQGSSEVPPAPVEPFADFQKWLPSLLGTWQTVRMDIALPIEAWLMLHDRVGGNWDLLPNAVSELLQSDAAIRDWHGHRAEMLARRIETQRKEVAELLSLVGGNSQRNAPGRTQP